MSLAFRQEALLPLTAGHSMERPAFGVRPLLFHLSVFSQCFLNVFDNFFYFRFHNKNNFNVTANVKRDIFWQNLPLTKWPPPTLEIQPLACAHSCFTFSPKSLVETFLKYFTRLWQRSTLMSKQMSKDVFLANFPTDQMTNAHPAFSARQVLFHFITKLLVWTLFTRGPLGNK